MQVSVESTSRLGRRLNVVVPAESLQIQLVDKLAEFSQKANLAGFRQGKVPKRVIEQRFGEQIHKEIVSNVVQSSLEKALKDKKLEPAERPNLENLNDKKGEPLEFSVTFEVFPEIEICDFSELKITKSVVDINESDVTEYIDKLRNENLKYIALERPSAKDDIINFNYSIVSRDNGREKDLVIDSGNNIELDLSGVDRTFLSVVQDELIGLSASDTKEINYDYPVDWRDKELAGKKVKISIEINKVKEKQLPELDADFAKKMNFEGEYKEDKFIEFLTDKLKDLVDELALENQQEEVLQTLWEKHDIDIPKAMIDREVNNISQALKSRFKSEQEIIEEATKKVGLGLILDKIIEINNVIADKDKSKKYTVQLSKVFANAILSGDLPSDLIDIQRYINNKIKVEQVVEMIVKQASITERKSSVKELLNWD